MSSERFFEALGIKKSVGDACAALDAMVESLRCELADRLTVEEVMEMAPEGEEWPDWREFEGRLRNMVARKQCGCSGAGVVL